MLSRFSLRHAAFGVVTLVPEDGIVRFMPADGDDAEESAPGAEKHGVFILLYRPLKDKCP